MSKDTKVSIILGITLGIIFLVSTFLSEVVGAAISILACVLFGPLTVWKIESHPNVYALLISVIAGMPLLLVYGIEDGWIYLVGIIWLYGILSVQLSKALANSYDNILYIAEKFKKNK